MHWGRRKRKGEFDGGKRRLLLGPIALPARTTAARHSTKTSTLHVPWHILSRPHHSHTETHRVNKVTVGFSLCHTKTLRVTFCSRARKTLVMQIPLPPSFPPSLLPPHPSFHPPPPPVYMCDLCASSKSRKLTPNVTVYCVLCHSSSPLSLAHARHSYCCSGRANGNDKGQ